MIYTTAIHGNEPIPVFGLASLGVKQVVCNLKALCVNKRFLEKDLNQSFGTNGKTIEEVRAKEILREIPEKETVIDLHTMSAKSEPFAIVVDLKMVKLAALTGLKHVVYMSHNIKSGHSLIDHRNGISIETGNHIKQVTFETVCMIYKNIKEGKKHKFTLYEVYDVIDDEDDYQNFKPYKNEFIPVLAGEKAYNMPGLKAKVIKV